MVRLSDDTYMLDKFEEDLASRNSTRGVKPKKVTTRFYRGDVKSFLVYLDEKGIVLGDLGQEHIIAYFGEKNYRARTVSRQVYSIGKFFDFLDRRTGIKISFDRGFVLRSAETSQSSLDSKVAGEAEFKALVGEIRTHYEMISQRDSHYFGVRDVVMATLMFKGGVGIRDIEGLDVNDLTFMDESVHVVVQERRSRKSEGGVVFPLSGECPEVFNYPAVRKDFQKRKETSSPALVLGHRGVRLDERSMRKKIKDHLRKANLSGITPTSFRMGYWGTRA